MHEFLNMGGYAAYVWSSYGVAVAVLGANALWPYLRLRAIKRQIRMEIDDD